MKRIIFLTIFLHVLHISTTSDMEKQSTTFLADDPQKCLLQNRHLVRFEVLPGGGWDNLRNKDAGIVVSRNYSLCRTTDDGHYLVPDGIYTIPMKSSRMETYAELFEHWKNFTSTTSSTINVEAGLDIHHIGISGQFSHESESVRSKQVLDESITTRVQLRYVRYTAKLQPDTALDDTFRSRLLKIASHIQLNKTELASYESQLIVRDFGTHVITSIDAGATLVQLDQIKIAFARAHNLDKRKILVSASASFFGVFHIGSSYEHTVSKELLNQYLKNRSHSVIETYGGPTFKPQNFSLDDWVSGLPENLVVIDKSGDPIYYVITPTAFPELPLSTVYELTQYIKKAVQLYYKYNTYLGCTKADSPNFSFQANVDDGSCKSPTNNYTFGGVYQTCSRSGNYPHDLCSGLEQKNPLTGGYSCPEGYESVLLDQNSKSASMSQHRCHRCWIFAHCCKDYTYTGKADFSAYWCVAKRPVKQDSGFLFGGLFTSLTGNLFTGSRSCPLYFYPLKISADLSICVSDDYELGFEYSVPFAGFFSCKAGNPLKLASDSAERKLKSTRSSSLGAYLKTSGAEHWPRGCPRGFSEHLAVVVHGCEINYCIQSNALDGRSLPKIRRPPFIALPSDGFGDGESFKISENGLKWSTLDAAVPDEINHGSANQKRDADKSGSQLSQGVVATISVFATLAFVVLISFFVRLCKKTRKFMSYEDESSHPLMYGSASDHGLEVEIQS